MLQTTGNTTIATENAKSTHWFKRHQITTFFIIAYAITWGIGIIAILFPEQFTRIVGELNYFNPVAIIAIAAPTISATILAWTWEGKPGLKALYARIIQWRFGIQWYAFILIGIPFLGWLSTLVAGATPVFVITSPLMAVSVFLNLLYTGPLGEELGWRGYALPRLLKQFNPLVASLVLGFFWGVWHLPSFLISSTVQSGLSLPMFLLFGLCISIVMTWIFHHTGGSVLAAVLFHYTINISFSIIGAPMLAFGLELLMLAALVVVMDKSIGWFQNPSKSLPGLKRDVAEI